MVPRHQTLEVTVAKRKYPACRKWRCEEPPYLGGLCKLHHEEARAKEADEQAAIEALKTWRVEGRHLGGTVPRS